MITQKILEKKRAKGWCKRMYITHTLRQTNITRSESMKFVRATWLRSLSLSSLPQKNYCARCTHRHTTYYKTGYKSDNNENIQLMSVYVPTNTHWEQLSQQFRVRLKCKSSQMNWQTRQQRAAYITYSFYEPDNSYLLVIWKPRKWNGKQKSMLKMVRMWKKEKKRHFALVHTNTNTQVPPTHTHTQHSPKKSNVSVHYISFSAYVCYYFIWILLLSLSLSIFSCFHFYLRICEWAYSMLQYVAKSNM